MSSGSFGSRLCAQWNLKKSQLLIGAEKNKCIVITRSHRRTLWMMYQKMRWHILTPSLWFNERIFPTTIQHKMISRFYKTWGILESAWFSNSENCLLFLCFLLSASLRHWMTSLTLKVEDLLHHWGHLNRTALVTPDFLPKTERICIFLPLIWLSELVPFFLRNCSLDLFYGFQYQRYNPHELFRKLFDATLLTHFSA